ncbi:MAG: hypothetical protein ABIK09_11945 [Pseudomonadota bacterium]
MKATERDRGIRGTQAQDPFLPVGLKEVHVFDAEDRRLEGLVARGEGGLDPPIVPFEVGLVDRPAKSGGARYWLPPAGTLDGSQIQWLSPYPFLHPEVFSRSRLSSLSGSWYSRCMEEQLHGTGVDLSLIDEMLLRTPEERLDWLSAVLDFIEEARHANEDRPDQPPG